MATVKSALLFLVFCHLHAIALADCFWFDGLSRNDTNYAPCYQKSCCRSTDKCRTDGLCVGGNDTLWRESCSDSNWNDPSCPKLCVDGTGRLTALASYLKMMRTKSLTRGADENGQLRNSSDQMVTQCPGTDPSYCCGRGDNATTCCNEGKGLFILPNGTVSDKKPSSAGVVTTVTQGPGPTDTGNPKSTANASSSNTGAIVGGAVGGVAVVALLACGTWLFLRKRRSEKLNRQPLTSATSEMRAGELPADDSKREELDSRMWNEAAAGPATETPVELYGRRWIEGESGPQSPQEIDSAPVRR